MSIIQRTVTVARPFPLKRQVLLPDAYCKSYADALDSMHYVGSLVAGTYAILSEAEYTAKYVVS